MANIPEVAQSLSSGLVAKTNRDNVIKGAVSTRVSRTDDLPLTLGQLQEAVSHLAKLYGTDVPACLVTPPEIYPTIQCPVSIVSVQDRGDTSSKDASVIREAVLYPPGYDFGQIDSAKMLESWGMHVAE